MLSTIPRSTANNRVKVNIVYKQIYIDNSSFVMRSPSFQRIEKSSLKISSTLDEFMLEILHLLYDLRFVIELESLR